MTAIDDDEIARFRSLLEMLGWRFQIIDEDIRVIVGDVPDGMTQDQCWEFVCDWNDFRRLAAVTTSGTVQ
jgi:hypothetical protein